MKIKYQNHTHGCQGRVRGQKMHGSRVARFRRQLSLAKSILFLPYKKKILKDLEWFYGYSPL